MLLCTAILLCIICPEAVPDSLCDCHRLKNDMLLQSSCKAMSF